MSLKNPFLSFALLFVGYILASEVAIFLFPSDIFADNDLVLLSRKSFLALGLLGLVIWMRLCKETGLSFKANFKTLPWYWPFGLIAALIVFGQGGLPSGLFALKMLALGLIVGFQEELIFRGYVFHWFKAFSPRKLILFSALTFGAIHLTGLLSDIPAPVILAQTYFAAGLGVIFAYARHRDVSIMIPILVHAVFNFATLGSGGGVEGTFTTNVEQVVFGLMVAGSIAWGWGAFLLWHAGKLKPFRG